MSTIASKFAFSTRRHVLDPYGPYLSSLSPKTWKLLFVPNKGRGDHLKSVLENN
ncbi:hypothetical protein RHMOL_Rhmol07G0197900 [Rhododendron molle]|uniref:Uncharacterized protein n=1 Tax=Rhododendron molle TaxID=49168 RepID=A0ACC0N2S7_RHOML|nr:hypothetical protein RHMOL_Rhmol07G0197900 [Rhododendron molle]